MALGGADRRRPVAFGPVLAVLVLLSTTACSVLMAGTGAPDPVPAPVSARAAPDAAAPGTETIGRRLEAHRLAGATELVEVPFPDRRTGCDPNGAFPDAVDLDAFPFLAANGAQVLADHGYVTGWVECQQGADRLTTVSASVELADQGEVGAAIADLATAAESHSRPRAPGAPGGAVALMDSARGVDVVEIWVPVGRTLAYTLHEAPAGKGVPGAVRMSVAQARLLAGFTPTPPAEVAALPLDPDGLARFVIDPPGVRDGDDGPYDLESYLRLAVDPGRERDLLEANGFTGAYIKSSAVDPLSYAAALFTFPTSKQSNAVYTGFAELEGGEYGGTPFTLPAVPAAPCFVTAAGASDPPAYDQRCYVGYGSHLASVDVYGLSRPDDVATMNTLLPAERDLIDG
jgi:hypothetical protein